MKIEPFEHTDERKFVKPKNFKTNIDSIISELNELKIK